LIDFLSLADISIRRLMPLSFADTPLIRYYVITPIAP